MKENSRPDPTAIQRLVTCHRWADVVVHAGTAYWVEVAEDTSQNADGQIRQVLAQVDITLASLGANRSSLLQVLIHLSDLKDVETLNPIWDAWIKDHQPPVRACVQSGLAPKLKVEMVITAAAGQAPA